MRSSGMVKAAWALALGLAMAMAPSAARANSIVIVHTGTTPNGVGGNDFTYTATASPDTTEVLAGDYFSLIDFQGLTGGIGGPGVAGVGLMAATGGLSDVFVTGTLWTYDSPALTPFPPLQFYADSGAILNPRFTYHGPPIAVFPVSALLLGTFTLRSNLPAMRRIIYTSQDHRIEGGGPSEQGNSGFTDGPSPAVPEPNALALVLPGLLPLGFMLMRRRSKTGDEQGESNS